MKQDKQKEFDKELIKLKFKKKWVDDKSGFWWEKKFKIKDLKCSFNLDNYSRLYIEIETVSAFHDDNSKSSSLIKKFKINNINTVKQIIKKYTK